NSYGPDHPEVARDLNNLAMLLKNTNRLKEAEPLYERALKIDEKTYGRDHPNVAIRLNNIAMLLKKTNCLKEAELLERRGVEILINFSQTTGHQHPHLLTFTKNYVGLLSAMGWSEDQVRDQLRRMGVEFE
ncbi:MAG: tetratricopeptide repeat protein, partial [Salibacteraceae bacterium]